MTSLTSPNLINTGLSANDGTGDNLRQAFTIINENTSNLVSFLTNVPSFSRITTDSIVANIGQFDLTLTANTLTVNNDSTFGGNITTAIGTITASSLVGSLTGDVTSHTVISGVLHSTGDGVIEHNLSVLGNTTINGDLTVFGNVTTVTTSEFFIDHPTIKLGGANTVGGISTPLTYNDLSDRGVEFEYFDTSAKKGFFGYNNSTSKFVYLTDTTAVSTSNTDIYSGTYGTAKFGIVEANVLATGSSTFNTITANVLTVNNGINGQLATFWQPNVTKLGTLTELNVNGNVAVGNVIITANDVKVNGYSVALSSQAFTGGFVANPTQFGAGTATSTGIQAIVNGGFSVVGNTTVSGTLTANAVVTNSFSASTLGGTLTTAAQPNITSVGTLGNLAVTNGISSYSLNAANSVSTATVNATFVSGTLTTVAQTNITSVGTLGNLNVIGNISGARFIGAVTGDVTGNVSGTAATVTGAAQPAITSVGTLGSLSVSGNVATGNINAGSGVIQTTGNITTTGNVVGSYLYGQVRTAAQPQITSLGTLANLSVTGSAIFYSTITPAAAIIPSGSGSQALGSGTNRFGGIYSSSIDNSGTITAGSFTGPHNGIIGGTTPAAASFTTINVTTGNINLTSGAAGIKFSDGTYITTAPGANSQTANVASALAGGAAYSIPVQSGVGQTTFIPNSATPGYLLTANAGSAPTWQAAPISLPSMASSAGMFLTNNGTSANWAPTSSFTANSAVNTTNIAITNDVTTNATVYPLWTTATSGFAPIKVSNTQLSFNANTGVLSAVGLSVTSGLTLGSASNRLNSGNSMGYLSSFYTSGTFTDNLVVGINYDNRTGSSFNLTNPSATLAFTSATASGVGTSAVTISTGSIGLAPSTRAVFNNAGLAVTGAITSSGNITASSFVGSGANITANTIPNSALVNSSITLGSSVVPIGSSISALSGLTSVTATDFYGAVTGTGANLTGGTVPNSALVNSSITVTAGTGLAGSATVSLGGTVSLSNTGVLSLASGGHITASLATGAITLGSDATSGATPNTLVSRDASGNFTGQTITASTAFAGPGSGLTGIPNTALSNSSVTIGTTSISLGSTVTTLAGLTSLTATNFYGRASQASYADLAEMYQSDGDYDPGTVVIFGGTYEVTVTGHRADVSVAGVVSTAPAYLMNKDETHAVAVALRGKVPVKVMGPVRKGDLLVTSYVPGHAESVGVDPKFGVAVFAKSLTENLAVGPKVINAVII
jgi:hypothetical protein